jgi:anti-sigma B factor antagonist
MTISVRPLEHAQIVDVSGDVDLKNSPLLREKLMQALKETPRVVLNLSAIRYIDSSGIAVMIEVLKASQRLNRQFVLFGMSPAVYNVFKLTHVLKIFQVAETEEQALGVLKA